MRMIFNRKLATGRKWGLKGGNTTTMVEESGHSGRVQGVKRSLISACLRVMLENSREMKNIGDEK